MHQPFELLLMTSRKQDIVCLLVIEKLAYKRLARALRFGYGNSALTDGDADTSS